MFEIKDEKDLPKTQRVPPMDFGALKVGQGFEVPITSSKDEATIRQRIWRYRQEHPFVRLSFRKVDENTMVLKREPNCF